MRVVKKKFLLVLPFFLMALHINGQNISVSSFKLIENDLTANTAGTMERDQNGETAALIKVVTSETGFSFDGGMVGIVKTRQEVGEIWVYVPHGIKKMSIRHPQLGGLRDYYFPISVEKARTYEMVITTGKVQTIVNQSLKKQFVIFSVSPHTATVEFNGEILELDETGYAEIGVPYGTYSYRISCPDYHTTAGNLEIKDGGDKPEVTVNLTPNFGWLEVSATPDYNGAVVYVDGKKMGTVPFEKLQIKSGTHRLKIERELYKDYESEIEVKDGQVCSFEISEMVPNFANVELVVDEKSEIWVDGELKGTGKWSGPLEIGDHRVETKQVSHVPSSETVRIFDAEPRVIQLKQPTPLYSSMEITSIPSRAKVFIDGVEVGVTPLVLNEVLIGTRELAFEKEGYDRHIKRVSVDYGVSSTVKAVLTDPSDEPLPVVAATPQSTQQVTEQQVTPVGNSTEPKLMTAETEKKQGIMLQVKHPSDYKLFINSVPTGNFSGSQYDLGSLGTGTYDIKVAGKKYAGRKSFNVNEGTSELYLKTKTKNNYFQSNASIYAGGTCTAIWLLGGIKLGGYFKGINAEYNYVHDGIETWNDFRVGYGINVGRSFLITPQIGYYGAYYEDNYSDGWGSYYEYYDEYNGVALGCRFQYCIAKYVSLAVTPVYYAGYDADVELSVIFTLPFTKK